MARISYMQEILEDKNIFLINRRTCKIRNLYIEHTDNIQNNLETTLTELTSDKKGGSLVISFLRSSYILNSHEFYIAYYEGEPFVEEEPACVHFNMKGIFNGIEADWREMDEELCQNFIREYVTLEMLKNSPIGWQFKEIVSYDTVTSLPQYKNNGRGITQEDVDELNRVLNIYGINTPNRIAHFLAQGQVETNGGNLPVEQYKGDDIFEFLKKYETEEKKKELGNIQDGDGAFYRGAGIVQITGRAAYESFSAYKNDPKIAEDGALYVAQNYFWEAGAYYWSVYKPSTANDDRYNFNKMCDENESVGKITGILNGDETDQLDRREKTYIYYIGELNNGN